MAYLKDVEKQLADLRAKGDKDTVEELLKLRREQFALRVQRATGQTPKPDQFTKVRKNIARVKTVQAELRAKKTGEKA
ncbi:MAG: 50S ribosomal protein L29 [Alphaproteobacteria bacterium]|nr:MAG: 50S ribosomal protein L29 [Alphaproteobacteria bacterium]